MARPDRAGEPAGTVLAEAPPVPEPAARLVAWQRAHGRRGLPWQGARDPYRVWLSEIMLQQTQVAAVIPYYERFIARFPDVRALAGAGIDEVLALWSGLGYYSRARNLHACAQQVVQVHGGQFPREPAALARLPGIGRSTAAAIAAFAFGERAAILDGNVKRVLARVHGVEGFPGERAVEKRLWTLAEAMLPSIALAAADVGAMATYTQALMDLGATVCTRTRPRCQACPMAQECVARRTARVQAIPAARPRRELPARRTAMLVLRRAGCVLVERRPPSGIWGGLWSLPESQAGSSALAAAESAARFGVRVERAEPLLPFEHAFTHLRLRVEPWLVEVADGPGIDAAGGTANDAGHSPERVRNGRLARGIARAALQADDRLSGQPEPAPAGEGGLLGGDPVEACQAPAGPWRWLAPSEIEAAGLPQPIKRLLRALAAPALL